MPDRVLRPAPVAALLDPGASPWSTRSIAQLLGVTQSAVSRTWAAYFHEDEETTRLLDGQGFGDLRLCAVRVDARGIILVLRQVAATADRRPAGRSVSSLRSILALPAAQPVAGARGARDFIRRATQGCAEGLVLSSESRTTLSSRGVAADLPTLLGWLANATRQQDPHQLHSVAQDARAWCQGGRATPFEWVSRGSDAEEMSGSPAGSLPLRDALDAVQVLREALVSRQLSPADRFTSTMFSQFAGCSRDAARNALARLEADLMIVRRPDRGYQLLVPAPDDVLQVYAARRSLGTLLIRRAASEGASLHRSKQALEDLAARTAFGDSWAVGEADLRFQEAIAAEAGAPRVAVLFSRLTQQLRLFIAVLGIRYQYPSEASLRDDRALMDALLQQDERRAVEHWRAKAERAVGYMVQQLPS